MPNRDSSKGKVSLFEKVLVAGCVDAFAAYIYSESAFTITILSVIVLAIVALFQEVLW